MAGTATPIRRSRVRLARSDRAEEWLAPSDHQSESIPADSLISLHDDAVGLLISPHDDAVGRLKGALAEQRRRRRQYEAAVDTSDEPNAYVRRCEATAVRGK